MSAQTQAQRDERGRFAEKNSGGPGNPFARQVAKLKSVMLATLNEDEMEAITLALIEKAKKGDVQAAKLLFSYALGKPVEGAQPDHVELEEWEIQKQTSDFVRQLPHVAAMADGEWGLKILRGLRCVKSQEMDHQLKEGLQQRQKEQNSEKCRQKRTEEVNPAPSPNGFSETPRFTEEQMSIIDERLKDTHRQNNVM